MEAHAADSSNLTSVTEWLLSDGSVVTAEELLASLCEILEARGIPIWRCSTSLLTLHPEVFVRNVVWMRGAGCKSSLRSHDLTQSPGYRNSPVFAIHEGLDHLRKVIRTEQILEDDYPVFGELAKEGATDYLALALPFKNGRRSFISFATDHPGGFNDDQIQELEFLQSALSLRFELESSYFATKCLLEVYLGHNASRRVLDGAFRRGTGESIDAAVFSCDLRGFTAMSDRLPVEIVVSLLDRYFECVAGSIMKHGGEVMKFIGDAVLAIFPQSEGSQSACDAALAAAEEAIAEMAKLEHAYKKDVSLEVGIALHVGSIFYGNIGAQDRLDFTIIGPTVNETCRLESLCKDFSVPLVLSSKFVAGCSKISAVSLGKRSLKGVAEEQEVFTLKCFN